ncbi:hypothetical protein U1Q18_015735 [Sarracenia purpurea var. burkii]
MKNVNIWPCLGCLVAPVEVVGKNLYRQGCRRGCKRDRQQEFQIIVRRRSMDLMTKRRGSCTGGEEEEKLADVVKAVEAAAIRAKIGAKK